MAGIGHVSGARLEHALAAYLAVGVLKANAQLNWQMDVGNTTAGDMELIALTDFRQPGEVVLRVMLDIIVYVLMVAWLSFKAWQVVLPRTRLRAMDVKEQEMDVGEEDGDVGS